MDTHTILSGANNLRTQRLLHQKASIYMIVERNCAWTIHFSDENRSGAVENYRRE